MDKELKIPLIICATIITIISIICGTIYATEKLTQDNGYVQEWVPTSQMFSKVWVIKK